MEPRSPGRADEGISEHEPGVEVVIDAHGHWADPLELPTARELYEHGAGELTEGGPVQEEGHSGYEDTVDQGEALDADGQVLDEARDGLPQNLGDLRDGLPISMARGGAKPKRAKKKGGL